MTYNMVYGFVCSLGQPNPGMKHHRVAIVVGASFSSAFLIILLIGLFVWWRYRHNKQIFFDVNG